LWILYWRFYKYLLRKSKFVKHWTKI
jgi:hypothetical protein